MNEGKAITNQKHVIHIEKQNKNSGMIMINKHGRIHLAAYETFRGKKRIELMKPCSRSLFQSIQRLLKTTNMT